jgi:DNA-binding response OmpR family regulator
MAISRRHILLIEEHPDVRDAFTALFESLYDYALHVATNTRDAHGFTSRRSVDLAVVDLTLTRETRPRLDLIRTWRRDGFAFPVITTSALDYDGLSIEAFEAGADDFLRKPYLFAEMRARIQRQLARRLHATPGVSRVDGVNLPEQPFTFAGATISPDMTITFPNGAVSRLSAKQLGILREFNLNAGELLLKDKLLYVVWGADANVNSASVHQYVHVLRKLYRDAGIDLNAFVTPESKAGWRISRAAISA